jgi:hypothetical protein
MGWAWGFRIREGESVGLRTAAKYFGVRDFFSGEAGALLPEGAPFEVLQLDRDGIARVGFVGADGLDEIDEGVGVPAGGDDAEDRFVGGRVVDDRAGAGGESGGDGMGGGAGVPVFAVGEIALATVHDGVPEGQRGGHLLQLAMINRLRVFHGFR